MKRIALVLGVTIGAASSLSANAFEQTLDNGLLADPSKSVCTQEIRTLLSINTYMLRRKDSSGNEVTVQLPSYRADTIPVDCVTGKRIQ
ncbi:hypothetical protein A8H39_01870 [Paraburkholderia fungorum]|uniref:hypothetical protein n=1 Tax=Paraburkholderia fungorum TaxID=134537 RepID=UPI000480561F|nr:hypothetical protein [Paraburkholderia fungorum]PNE59919.1 hypothetical protein A8H39_01870 [Paraburkholderia fungorum]